jgi:hypothetical protein
MRDKKLIKTVIIARSGIYNYRAEELKSLKLNIADAPERKAVYKVYRPAIVLSNDKDKFSMMTLTNNHPTEDVEGNNFKQYAIGFTGENVEAEWNDESGEVVLKTRVALVDDQAINNYMVGIDEVSPGYYANFRWEKGTSPKGEDYDIIMVEVELSNHLAMTPKARGGKVACIIDSQGGDVKVTKYASSLIRQIKRFLSGVKDSDGGKFRLLCEELANQKDMKDDEKTNKIEELKQMASDLPESDNKNMLTRYIEDLNTLGVQAPEVAKAAADKVASLYEQLDTESMKEGETMADITTGQAKDAVSLEYIQAELTKLGQGMLTLAQAISGGGQGQAAPAAQPPATDNTPPAAQPPAASAPAAQQKTPAQDSNGMQPSDLVPKTDPPKAQDSNIPADPPKCDQKTQPVADSGMGFQNITMDSANAGKEGFMDFFNSKVKGGKR